METTPNTTNNVPGQSGSSSSGAAQRLRALSSRQERKLVNYLDGRFLDLTRNFKKRSQPSSTVQTLCAFLETSRALLAFILQIPPIDPSTSLRTAYLLRLTGDVLGAIPGYKLSALGVPVHATLQDLLDFLDDLDQAWITVLRGQVWDPEAAEGVDLRLPQLQETNGLSSDDANSESDSNEKPQRSSPPSQTDLARLRSLLFSGEATLEEWLSHERDGGDTPATFTNGDIPGAGKDAADDISVMLARMGLLEQFDALFVRTLDHLGGFSDRVAENFVHPGEEVVMEAPMVLGGCQLGT
ncbi:unnamed protein product [Cyclocybe aegerita]|uniref:Uncharacterized protein n=1 Tax=Cyclocybe aegerita TaxID=1973307 RepID=A0A8S0XIJ8_CYCAE|nr:unnamed protein product [Cyclocybe aegerita]